MNLAYKRFIFIIFFMTVSSCSYQKTTIEIGSLFDPTWDFSNSSQLNFDENYVEIKNGKAQLKPLDLKHEGDDFNNGTHVGSSLGASGLLRPKISNDSSLDVRVIIPNLASSVVGYWKFDGTLNDSTGNFSSGAPLNNETYNDGLLDLAIQPNGSTDGFDLGTANVNTLRYTIMFWFRGGEGANYTTLFHRGDAFDCFYNPSIDLNLSNKKIYVQESGCAGTGTITNNLNYDESKWNHVVVTRDNNIVKVYINSVLQVEDTSQVSPPNETGKIFVGTNYHSVAGSGQYSSSQIDELSVWSVALSEEDIQKTYDTQLIHFADKIELAPTWTPKWDNIVGYWKMDGNWQDSSGNGNQGTSSGGVTFGSDASVGSQNGVFDGINGEVIVGNDYNTTVISISAWAKAHSLVAGAAVVSSAAVSSFIQVGGAHNPWSFTCATDPDGITVNQWYHLVGTSDGTTSKLYVNGKLVESDTCSHTWTTINIGKRSDNIYFDGEVDDLAIWDIELDSSDVQLIYHRQKQKYAGHYDSEIIDLGSTNSYWPDLSWSTNLPFSKELVGGFDNDGNPDSESSSDYSGLSGDFSNGLLGYWPLNEIVADSVSGSDFKDKSININDGNETGGVQFGQTGILSNSSLFDGLDDTIALSNVGDLSNGFSSGGWVNIAGPNTLNNTQVVMSQRTNTDNYDLQMTINLTTNEFRCYFENATVISNSSYVVSGGIDIGKWYHYICVFSPNSQTLTTYVNGQPGAPVSTGGNIPPNTGGPAYLGSNKGTGSYYHGRLDEFSIWSSILTTAQIQQLYRRGANRIKFQVKSCVDSSCECKSLSTSPVGTATDCDGDTIVNALDFDDIHKAEFIGPGGDGTTYYSELFNRKSTDLTFNCGLNTSDSNSNVCVNDEITLGAGPKPTGPVIDYSDFPLEARPDANPYFQYRVYMEADENTACNGNPCLPELTSVNLNPSGLDRYYGALQEITPKSPITYSEMKSISIQADPCATFRLSPDGTNEYYYSAGSWVLATDITHRSDQLTVEQNILKFAADHGPGQLYIKAFLETSSNQTANCGIDEIDVDFK